MQCELFKEMATHLSLLATDDEWYESLAEASGSFLPYQTQSLFATILVFGEPAKPQDLWAKYKDPMGEVIMWKLQKVGWSKQ